MQRASNLNRHPNPKGYLFTAATNQWRDTLRKRKHEEVEIEIEKATYDISFLDSIGMLISLLPIKQASSILLTEYFGFSAKEVAKMLDMTIGGVKAALHRGRTTLIEMQDSSLKNREPVENLIDRLLFGLKQNDHKIIVKTYHNLVTRGVSVTQKEKYFVFTISDPDGNVFEIREKI
ncbi:putative transcriptional regulator [Aquibacillus albus]|uniref:Transcriptional regulator n=1 Tax=Aquibacillus albus TaxID=1168171 RepID=A0ABS2N468_9BACI|nr:putative transcriptional regulator [Aquibacillus albus]